MVRPQPASIETNCDSNTWCLFLVRTNQTFAPRYVLVACLSTVKMKRQSTLDFANLWSILATGTKEKHFTGLSRLHWLSKHLKDFAFLMFPIILNTLSVSCLLRQLRRKHTFEKERSFDVIGCRLSVLWANVYLGFSAFSQNVCTIHVCCD